MAQAHGSASPQTGILENSGSYLLCGAQHRTWHINEIIIPIDIIFINLREEVLSYWRRSCPTGYEHTL